MHSTGCHRYAPLDVSETALGQAADALTADYDWLELKGQLGTLTLICLSCREMDVD